MKSLLTICLVLLLATVAQSQTKTFVRIFDEQGKKTYKGYIMNTSDSSLTIGLNKERFEIPASQIAIIKLKRSFGHTVLITTLIAGTCMAIIGEASAALLDPDEYTAGAGALAGFIFGAGTGAVAVAGSIIAGTRNRPVFIIDRKQEQWMKIKVLLKKYYSMPENQTAIAITNQTH